MQEVKQMAYQQTVLIPLPKQHLREAGYDTYGRRDVRRDYRNRQNTEMNTILSFFD